MAPKRGRPRNDEPNADTANKKPRLTRSAATKKATPGAVRPNPTPIPEYSGQRGRNVLASGSPKRSRLRTAGTCEIPDSDEEGYKTNKDKANGKSKSPATRSNKSSDGVYDLYGSDEERNPAQTPTRSAAKSAPATSGKRAAARESTTVAAKLRDTNIKPKATSQAPGLRTARAAKETHSKTASHSRGQGQMSENGRLHVEQDSTSEHVPNTPVAARTGTSKGAPLPKANGATPTLKGILTPSRRHSERNAKSVAFDRAHEIFFADLPNKAAKSKSSPQTRLAGNENRPVEDPCESKSEASEEEEVCIICSQPESKPPNQILFCDSCDKGVHQDCYGVAKIPKGDWLCKDCSQDPLAGTTEAKASVNASDYVSGIPNFEQHLRSLQRVLLDRCTGRRRIKLCGQDEAYEKTIQLVEQTVLAGEGNSMLVIGARGCGKTTMVNSVLADVALEHRHEFHVVRLNGFIHTDDKLALKEIWRQLGKEMEVEDDLIGKTTSYADTLASLLALLSHPAEIADAQEGVTSKSVIFVLDEFDLFATHARQTLLYNLFDIAQARKAPIAVLGLTNRIDVVESLEKRVKSRFSHRSVYMSLPKTPREYWEICRQGLVVDDEDAQAEGLDVSRPGFAAFHAFWASKIAALSADPAFTDHLAYHYARSKSAPAFLSGCVLPLARLAPTDTALRLGAACRTGPPDSKLHLLEALSDLDLSLLISAARLDIVAHTDTVNFAMAYDEYSTLIGRQRVQSSTSGMLALGGGVRAWGRGVAEMAWERLVTLRLLLPTGMGSKDGGLEARMWKVDVTLEEIPVAVKLNTVLARWCKEI